MIFDVETDGLLDVATKIHVLSYMDKAGDVHSLHDYDDIRKFLLSAKVLIGHNIVCFDIPVLEKILDIKIEARLIDTLPLSWYLNHKRVIHGLDAYGTEFGVPKPKIDNWEDQTVEEYTHRCQEDVKINARLWKQLRMKLMRVYEDDKEAADKLIRYLTFKMDCLREQEKSKWEFDRALCIRSIEKIEPELEELTTKLAAEMPSVTTYAVRQPPAKPFKKDGSLSTTGCRWFKLLKDEGLPRDHREPIKVAVGEKEANPGSSDQVKAWLFSLGWVPKAFKYVPVEGSREKRPVPQVRVLGDEGKELCPSVLKLAEKFSAVSLLANVTTLQHRLSIFKKFLKDEEDGKLIAGAGGLTNTLRFKHRVLVNLPGVDKAWGEEIRGCLTSVKGQLLCGSDMCSLEDNTKRHYMKPLDPEYVEEMSDPNFDSHLDLAKFAGAVTKAEVDAYMSGKEGAKDLKSIRKNFKAANYACVYGVGAVTLARQLEISEREAQKLIDAYWGRNWAVKEVAKSIRTRTVDGEMWLLNPVSGLWYSLRAEKDIFSTLNQGTGVWCFDLWVQKFRAKRPQLTGQFHDEVILSIKEGSEDKCVALLKGAIQEVNDELKLNVTLDVDIQFGERYSAIH